MSGLREHLIEKTLNLHPKTEFRSRYTAVPNEAGTAAILPDLA